MVIAFMKSGLWHLFCMYVDHLASSYSYPQILTLGTLPFGVLFCWCSLSTVTICSFGGVHAFHFYFSSYIG
ncbi:hypothetical protein NC652_041034 [Populus alba x Populus x berolinensis]|nr:hypothetical protein NC652_041034 [Populus alba x Populus x berolinensis]